MKKRRDQILTTFMDKLQTNDIMWANEVRANVLVSLVMLICAILLAVTWILNTVGVFHLIIPSLGLLTVVGMIELLIPFGLCIYYKGQKRWLKFVLLIGLVIVFSSIDTVLTNRVTLLMVIPVVLSVRYYSKNLTLFTAVISAVLFFISSIQGASLGILNLNDIVIKQGEVIIAQGGLLHNTIRGVQFDMNEYIHSILINSYLPKLELFIVVSIVCTEISERSSELVVKQEELTKASVRIDSELKTAANIQSNMLPNEFPAFPELKEFDLYAHMTPAKQVGGDFYDFFMVDEDHLAFVIADVSDKGVPAALFMVVARTLIKANMKESVQANEVFEKVNNLLCEGNKTGFFVTAWLGLLNIKTGHINYVNAGHNPPIIGQNGNFKMITQKHGFVLAGMEDVKYKKQELQLNKGDILFIYTDGITEANNQNEELYGIERLIQSLNHANQENMVKLSEDVKKDLEIFTNGAEQFDDITLLAIKYFGDENIKEIEVNSVVENIDIITQCAEKILKRNGCPIKTMYQIDVAIDEIFGNICFYAYSPGTGKVKVRFEYDELTKSMIIEFKDYGIAFNPLENPDPDITLGIEERSSGGLGIFMVKKTMDDVTYKYEDSKNILTIKKVIQ